MVWNMGKITKICKSGYYRYLNTRTWELRKDAISVTIEGFEEFDLFVIHEENEWCIYDAISGRPCYDDTANSLKSIKAEAKKSLSKSGKKRVVESLKNSVMKHGISPRYSSMVFSKLNECNKFVDKENPFGQIIIDK